MWSIEELYKIYEKPIFRYFYGLTMDFHTAEELTQETFFQVIRTLPTFRGDSQVTTWLYKVARNVYSMWKRKGAKQFVLSYEEDTAVSTENEPADILEKKEQLKHIMSSLRELPETYREILWLREWQDLSYEQIALITGHSISWVKVTLHRARLSFRQTFRQKEE